jgi:radical SAM superfamily enzyme YgiQ (UPF0313 family)
LERAGFAPRAVDLAVEPLDETAVRRARLVALSVPMHTALRIGVRAAERVRALNPDAAICFYGLYAVLNREHLLARGADAVFGGEFEEQLVDAACRLERDEPLASDAAHLARLDFPVPSRDHLPPLTRYAHLERDGVRRPAGSVEASRGCLHQCLHCPITPVYGGRFFVMPTAVVLEDIRSLAARGARHITFADPDFLNGPRHSLRIAEAMHAEFPDFTFDFTAKIEHLIERRTLLPCFAALGCAFVVSAVESLSDTVLRNLEKGHTSADVPRALHLVRAAGLALRPSLLPFTPWSTLDDYVELVEWVASEDLVACVDPVQLAIRLLIPPGSALLRRPEIQPFLAGLDREAFTHVWTHPDPRMERLYRTVSGLVHDASHTGEAAAVTFRRVRAAAHQARGEAAPAEAAATLAERRPVPPRLTEPWFC